MGKAHTQRKYQNQLPKFWRPKLAPSQCLDAKIIHWDLIDRFTSGTADKNDLWDWVETGYTYCKLIELHQADGTQFTDEAIEAVSAQIGIFDSVIQRYQITKRVAFNGPELCIARAAANVFDGLIDIDRNGIAVRAGQWAMQIMDAIRGMECQAMHKSTQATGALA